MSRARRSKKKSNRRTRRPRPEGTPSPPHGSRPTGALVPRIVRVAVLVVAALVGLSLGDALTGVSGPASFDGERALEHLAAMTRRGNRWYEAPERGQALAEMTNRLKPHVDDVIRQEVPVPHPDHGQPITLVNVLLRQHRKRPRRLLIGSHWDTRLWAEEDPDPTRRNRPIPGANDGTSGVAVMIELARVLASDPLPSAGVDFVLFDGEEYGRPGKRDYCQGSQAFAKDLGRFYPGAPPEAAIILDMVGDRKLEIRQEVTSLTRAPALLQTVWKAAGRLGIREFVASPLGPIYDDHSPLLERGIPSILLIDYDYPYWHTHGDTVDRCSAESLAKVGKVVREALIALDRGDP